MKLAFTAIFSMIILDHLHVKFPHGMDYQCMILFRNIIIVLLSICCFWQAKKTDINSRSIFAVGVVFSMTSLIYYILWWIFDIDTIFVFPVSFFACLLLLLFTSFKKYNYKSDKIGASTINICFWNPQNAKTIFPSLLGAPIGSVSIYINGYLYGFKWSSKKFEIRKTYPEIIEKKFITVDTQILPNRKIISDLKNIVGTKAHIFGLRIKCVFVIRKILCQMGSKYKPSLLEFIPSLYAKKILRLKNG